MKGFGKSEKGSFEVVGQADGPGGQKALLIGCNVDMNAARKAKQAFKGFQGFVFKKQF